MGTSLNESQDQVSADEALRADTARREIGEKLQALSEQLNSHEQYAKSLQQNDETFTILRVSEGANILKVKVGEKSIDFGPDLLRSLMVHCAIPIDYCIKYQNYQEQYQNNVASLNSEISDLNNQKTELENKIKELEKGKIHCPVLQESASNFVLVNL